VDRSIAPAGRTLRPTAGGEDRIASLVYEDICREEVNHGLLDEATGRCWGRAGRWWTRDAEIDLLAFGEDRASVLFGESKWSRRPLGTNILRDLEEASNLTDLPSSITQRQYALFSRSGFTDAMKREAAARSDVLLIHGLTRTNN